jgi:hypothetical protein
MKRLSASSHPALSPGADQVLERLETLTTLDAARSREHRCVGPSQSWHSSSRTIVDGAAARISRSRSSSASAAPVGFAAICSMTSGVPGVSAPIRASTETNPDRDGMPTRRTGPRRAIASTSGG